MGRQRAFVPLHWFRRLRIRWEIRDHTHEAFLTLARALMLATPVIPTGVLRAPFLDGTGRQTRSTDAMRRMGDTFMPRPKPTTEPKTETADRRAARAQRRRRIR